MSEAEKVKDKIQKLLAHAQGTSNEEEAAVYMGKVQELLAEYNLSMADLSTAPEADDKRTKDKLDRSAMYQYQRELMEAIADAHYCMYWTSYSWKYTRSGRTQRKPYHVLLGREVNVLSSQMMFDYVNKTIERLSTAIYGAQGNLSRSAISFKEGCASRLIERLQQRRREADEEQERKVREAEARAKEYAAAAKHPAAAPQEAPSAGALVLLTEVRQSEADLNNDFHYGYEPGTTALRRLQNQARWEQDAKEARERRIREAEELRQRIEAMTPKERDAYFKKQAEEEAKEEERSKKYWDRQRRLEQERWNKKDHSAYSAGRRKGNEIGLDPQVGRADTKQIG